MLYLVPKPSHVGADVDGLCDIPPLSKGGQSKPGSIRGANTEALTHNTYICGPNKELLHEFLSYKRDT
jgi:hypothetical protein